MTTLVRLLQKYTLSGVEYSAGDYISLSDDAVATAMVSAKIADNNANAIARAIAEGEILRIPENDAITNSIKSYDKLGGIAQIPSLALRPPANVFGVGQCQIGSNVHVSNGTDWRDVAVTNANGDLVGSIVPRTDTLANLQTVIGSAGEIASPTDSVSLLKYKGTVAGGDVFYKPESRICASYGGTVYQTDQQISTNGLAQPLGNGLLFDQFYYAQSSTGGACYFSYDAISWIKMGDAPITGYYGISGNTGNIVIAVPASSGATAYWTVAQGATWTAFTTPLSGVAAAWKAPIPCGGNYLISIKNDSSNESALFNGSAEPVLLALPSTAIWDTIVTPVFNFNGTNKIFAVSTVSGTASVAVLKGAGPTWAAADLPSALDFPVTKITATKVLIYDSSTTNGYIASYNAAAGTMGAFTQIVLPIAASISAATETHFVIGVLFGGHPVAYASTDGFVWELVETGGQDTSLTSITALENGVLFRQTGNLSLVNFKNQMAGATRLIMSSVSASLVALPGGGVAGFANSGSKVILFNPPRINPADYATETTVAATFTGAIRKALVTVTTAANTFTALTLPIPTKNNFTYSAMFTNAQASFTVTPQAVPTGTTINGAANVTLAATAFKVYRFIYSGGQWWVV